VTVLSPVSALRHIILPCYVLSSVYGQAPNQTFQKQKLTHTHTHRYHPNPSVMAGDDRNEMTWNSWFAADILLLLTEILRRIILWLLLLLSYLLVDCHRRRRLLFSSGLQGSRPKAHNNIHIYNAHAHALLHGTHRYITSVYYALVISLLPTSRLLHSTRLDAVRQKIKTNKIHT